MDMMTKGRRRGSENPHPSISSSCVAIVSVEDWLFFWLFVSHASSVFVMALSSTMAAEPFPSSRVMVKIVLMHLSRLLYRSYRRDDNVHNVYNLVYRCR